MEDFLTKKQQPNRGELPQYYVQDNHEPIISREDYALVQALLAKLKRERIPSIRDESLSHKIICGDCGSICVPMTWNNCPHGTKVYHRRAWRCINKYSGETCATPAIKEEDLQARFLEAAKSIFSNKEQYIQAFEANMEEHFGYAALEQELAALDANSDGSPDCEAHRQELQDRILDCKLARYRAGNYLQVLQQTKMITAFTKKRFLQMVDHVTVSRYTAIPLDSGKKRKVAAYAKVSTDHEEQQTSYEAQVKYYTNYIQSRSDWEFVAVYTDEGISGTATKNRDGFNCMIADALDGKIDLILTKSVSRFARNTVDSLTAIRKLKEHGTECYFEKENIWSFDGKSELPSTIMASLAQEESRSLSENIT